MPDRGEYRQAADLMTGNCSWRAMQQRNGPKKRLNVAALWL